ncbi:unnamed protein product [Haemonchus placei]|uniref:Zyxin n=1 Tax=Haemonchus placei TaxID=6290 RepID=A0A0N4WHZ2_HAEPC|nr:unnamed protein product [Haemonchus placei]
MSSSTVGLKHLGPPVLVKKLMDKPNQSFPAPPFGGPPVGAPRFGAPTFPPPPPGYPFRPPSHMELKPEYARKRFRGLSERMGSFAGSGEE